MMVVGAVVGHDDDVADQPADLRDAEGYEVLFVVHAALFAASAARTAVR